MVLAIDACSWSLLSAGPSTDPDHRVACLTGSSRWTRTFTALPSSWTVPSNSSATPSSATLRSRSDPRSVPASSRDTTWMRLLFNLVTISSVSSVGEVARLRAITQRIEGQHRNARGHGLGRYRCRLGNYPEQGRCRGRHDATAAAMRTGARVRFARGCLCAGIAVERDDAFIGDPGLDQFGEALRQFG